MRLAFWTAAGGAFTQVVDRRDDDDPAGGRVDGGLQLAAVRPRHASPSWGH